MVKRDAIAFAFALMGLTLIIGCCYGFYRWDQYQIQEYSPPGEQVTDADKPLIEKLSAHGHMVFATGWLEHVALEGKNLNDEDFRLLKELPQCRLIYVDQDFNREDEQKLMDVFPRSHIHQI